MGNSSRPGSIVIKEIDHPAFHVQGEKFFIRESIWNGDEDEGGRSYDLVQGEDEAILTEEESFDSYPTDARVAAVLEEHGFDAELVGCKFCGDEVLKATAHRHQREWVGAGCHWDERLRMTE